jgi:ATP-dependent exoDNAse (exonuclease V) beta subunit
LLYVAVTRARDLLVLPWLPGYRKVTDLFKLLYSKEGADFEGSPLAARWHESELPAGEAPEGDAPILDAVLHGPAATIPAGTVAPPPPELLPPAARGAIARAERRGRAAHALLDAAMAGTAEPDLQGFDDAQRLAAREAARRFLASPLGRRALAAPARLLETPLTRVAPDGAVEDLRLDLAFRENGSWVLVDYKNDREGARSGARRAAELRAQLAAYADALEALTGVPVGEAHIAFLATGETRTFRRAELRPAEALDRA